ncbi:MAG: RsbRD N-terminal domain-containing protein [Candidatus Aminicenantes bacterium]|nr:RsbRD N-terminal domain-containing protein [Candidatus Aminicenantes bacterium]
METKKDAFRLTSVSRKLIDLIEKNADELTGNWLSEIRKDSSLTTYHSFDNAMLYDRAYRVYSQLGKWVSYETTKEQIAADYVALGAERRKEGFSLSEVIRAIILIRRILWRKIMEEGFLDTAFDLYQAIELNHRVTLFFDRAIYSTVCGYEKS